MANKFVNKTQLDYDLKRIADALKAASNSSSNLTFPEGMCDCIQNHISWKPVSSVTEVSHQVAPGSANYILVDAEDLENKIGELTFHLKGLTGYSSNLSFPNGIIGIIQQGCVCVHNAGAYEANCIPSGVPGQHLADFYCSLCNEFLYQDMSPCTDRGDGYCSMCGASMTESITGQCAHCGTDIYGANYSYCEYCGEMICGYCPDYLCSNAPCTVLFTQANGSYTSYVNESGAATDTMPTFTVSSGDSISATFMLDLYGPTKILAEVTSGSANVSVAQVSGNGSRFIVTVSNVMSDVTITISAA